MVRRERGAWVTMRRDARGLTGPLHPRELNPWVTLGALRAPRMREHGGSQKAEVEPPWLCPEVERLGAPCAVAIWTPCPHPGGAAHRRAGLPRIGPSWSAHGPYLHARLVPMGPAHACSSGKRTSVLRADRSGLTENIYIYIIYIYIYILAV